MAGRSCRTYGAERRVNDRFCARRNLCDIVLGRLPSSPPQDCAIDKSPSKPSASATVALEINLGRGQKDNQVLRTRDSGSWKRIQQELPQKLPIAGTHIAFADNQGSQLLIGPRRVKNRGERPYEILIAGISGRRRHRPRPRPRSDSNLNRIGRYKHGNTAW